MFVSTISLTHKNIFVLFTGLNSACICVIQFVERYLTRVFRRSLKTAGGTNIRAVSEPYDEINTMYMVCWCSNALLDSINRKNSGNTL